ncbi:MAG TPA: GNAT family N-acetyltransferase [Reyranella sp.]|jgi:predicted N-acetyltransferase YhbS|nr:GNAT family N-acetyltransferase [Reyranella sp.]
MSDSLLLRAATAVDAPTVAAIIAASFEEYRGKLEPESGAFRETAEDIAAELAHESGAIIAERNGKIVGCVMLKLVEDDLYFGRLSVVPAARGQGVARRLIEAVEDEARRRELAGVRLGVRIVLTENQRLFTQLGYVEISREAHEGFDHPTSINMRKALR